MPMTYLKNKSLALALLAAVFAQGVQAHGPSRQKVTVERDIAASVEACWQIVGDFAALHLWLPPVDSSEIISGKADEAGAIRLLNIGDKTIEETLKSVSAEKRRLKYKISKGDVDVLPVNNYSSTLSVKESEAGCKVVWLGAFYRGYPNNDPPEHLNDKTAIEAVTGLYNLGLDSLKTYLENLN